MDDDASCQTPSTDGDPDQLVAGWLATVVLEGSTEHVPVVLDGREGNKVFIRQVDPCDGDDPPRTPIYDGDQIIAMQVVAAVGHHTSPDVGRIDDFLFGTRIVPVRREPGRVFARTLRRDETDDGTRVHLRPGDQLIFEEGSLVAQLDDIDDLEKGAAPPESYVPLTPVLWTWLTMCGRNEARTRYLLAAARRLDAAALRLEQVEALRDEIRNPDRGAPALRRALFELVGAVEVSMVALGRVTDMALDASKLIGATAVLPPLVITKQQAVHEIRNAYEHIEDRALGQVWKRPNSDALTIFNHNRLIQNNVIEYASYSIDLLVEVPALLEELRNFLKDVAGNE